MTLSPLTQRRLANFRANKRGYWSLIIFGVLFFITLFAEFLANDRPIVARIDGRWYAPVLVDYAESDIIEDGLPTLTDWHDRGFREEIEAKGATLIWPLIPYSYRSVVRDLGRPAPAPLSPSRSGTAGGSPRTSAPATTRRPRRSRSCRSGQDRRY